MRSGDDTALGTLVERYLIPLRRWASGRLPAWARDLRDTDDIVQDTLMATLRHLDGFEVMQALRPLLAGERYLPMLIITADDAPPVKQRALAMGARDFLAKPFDSVEALLRIRNLLVTRQLYLQLEREQQRLEASVEERTRALASTHIEIVYRLARENKDFRRVLYTTERSQLVLMAIPAGEEIGEETHEGIDQVLAFVEGQGEAVIEGERRPVRPGTIVVVPGGTRHNFIARGGGALKLVTVYTPPEHPDGTVHRTKEEAEEYEREHRH